jgi:hypothetical protein
MDVKFHFRQQFQFFILLYKGKVVPVLNYLFKHRSVKNYGGAEV